MIEPEKVAEIRRLFYAEHWKLGTIASFLHLHHTTVRAAVEGDRTSRPRQLRKSLADQYLAFIRQSLEQYPRLRATRIFEMVKVRGYLGSVRRLREIVRSLRPQPTEAFLRLSSFPAEQAQVDWADFGAVKIGRAIRRLSCFVMTLSYSRALFLEFFFDQSQESFLRGHVRAFGYFSGVPRVVLYDYVARHIIVVLFPAGLCGRRHASAWMYRVALAR